MLILCLFLSALPTQVLAYVGDIQPVGSNAVKQTKLSSGSLALQNDYIRVIARKDGTLSTAPATESADPTDRQTPYCYFVTYGSRHITHPASLRLKSLTFVNQTLNGGGAGFKDLAATVNGDYFAIPLFKLSGALAGTYLHLIEARGDVVIGPSEISLKASDVGIVGLGKSGQLIDSFGYALKLNGQERSYRNETYKGIYFPGSEALKLNLPNNTINAIVLAFDNSVTEAEIQAVLSVTQDSVDLPIHWLGSAAQMDPDAKINAMTIGDMKKSASGGLPLWNALLCASAFGLACAVFPRRKRRLG